MKASTLQYSETFDIHREEKSMEDLLKDYLDKYKYDIIDDIKELVAIPSESDDLEKVREALRFALDLAKKYGFNTFATPDDSVGVIEMGDGPETLGILTHVDVVPAGDPSYWDTDPYDAEVIEGRLYGRGTLDDKGMLISSLYAMRAVKDLGLPLHKKVQLIIGTQEEVEWTDMDKYVKEYPLPDYGFTPDGVYPICNIEKGYIDHTMEFDVSGEDPELLYLKELDIGTATNVVPGRADAVLSDGETVTVHGKACHSSQPENGINAMLLMGEELKKRNLATNKMLELLYAVCDDFADYEGSGLGLRSETEYYEGEFVHRNVFSPTMLNAKDGKAKLTVNVRFPYGESCERILKTLDEWAESHGGKTVASDSQLAVFVSKNRPFLKVLADAYEDVSCLNNEFSIEYGGTYAKAMPNIVSWGPIFPGEEDTTHKANEYIDVDSLMMSTNIFAEAIKNIVLSEESFK